MQPFDADDLREYKGAVHVHTAYSDSSGRMPYVLDCARKAGLDFVVVSDHGTLRARQEGWEGWHDGVLLVIGVEVTSLKGHSLVLGLDDCPRWRRAHPDDYLPEVRRAGGTAFICHPERAERGKLYRRKQVWPNLRTDAYAGIEIWSFAHDFVEWAYPWRVLQGLRDPDAGIAGPHPEVLRKWDAVAQRRPVSGIGALDAHEYRFPVPRLRWALLRVLPLEYQFRTVRTHVLTPPFTGDGPADVAALTAALAAGRCFTAYDLVGDATGARFIARGGGRTVTMGDCVARAPGEAAGGGLEFAARVPDEADLSLVRNSEVIATARGTELVHRDARPGVYRVEARRRNRPWVYTNHIYVRTQS